MEEKKLTDEEIIKAFEVCYFGNESCSACPYEINDIDCTDRRSVKDMFDLMNRQKAEIERLKASHKFIVTKGGRDYGKTAHFKIIDYDRLKEQNAELQKQVDELKEERENMSGEIFALETRLQQERIEKQRLREAIERVEKQAVKDTAKEIYCHIAKAWYDKEMLKIFREYLKERYGVEVE
jgi:vacuolar-type H+-ATPase subunit I/STV1